MNVSSNSNYLEVSNSRIQIWKGFFVSCCLSNRQTGPAECTVLTELLEKLNT